jgi:hypothetical protein
MGPAMEIYEFQQYARFYELTFSSLNIICFL